MSDFSSAAAANRAYELFCTYLRVGPAWEESRQISQRVDE